MIIWLEPKENIQKSQYTYVHYEQVVEPKGRDFQGNFRSASRSQ